MFQMLWPIFVVIGANTLYNIATKSTPGAVNPFASLSLTYLTAALLAIAAFFVTSPDKNLVAAWGKANWTAFALGGAVLFLELGYVYLYRAGWRVSVGSIVANVGLACVLLIVGVAFYREVVTLRQLLGMAVCGVGLALITL